MHRAAGLLAVVALVMAAVPISPALAPTSGPAVAPAALVSTVWKPIPSYRVAAHDEPAPYRDGCHAARAVTVPRACVIVHPRAAATVLLFGDSHAAPWYGAVRAAAVARGWRLLYLTKSSCPAADVAVRGYKMTVPYPQCSTWRGRALTGIAENRWGRVDVAVLSNWHFHTVLSSRRGTVVRGADKVRRWEAGMRRTLARVLLGVRQVVLLRDSPDLPGDAVSARACFARYRLAAQRKCGSTVAKALRASIWAAEKRAAASFPGRVLTVDLTTPTCAGGWCGPIARPYLAFKDDNHWTQTYVRALFSAPVTALVAGAMDRAAE